MSFTQQLATLSNSGLPLDRSLSILTELQEGKRFKSILDNVQKIRDGEPFSGRMKAEDAFDAIEQPGGPVGAAVGVGGANTGDPLTGL